MEPPAVERRQSGQAEAAQVDGVAALQSADFKEELYMQLKNAGILDTCKVCLLTDW